MHLGVLVPKIAALFELNDWPLALSYLVFVLYDVYVAVRRFQCQNALQINESLFFGTTNLNA